MIVGGEIVGAGRVVMVLGEKKDQVVAALRIKVRELAIMLMGYVKMMKLSGDPLHVRSGRLRRSITYKVQEDGGIVSGLVGTVVEYGRAHEFGVDKYMVVTVRDYLRKCHSRDTFAIRPGRAVRDAAGKTSARMLKRVLSSGGLAVVHSFSRRQHIKLPERSFLRSSLRELGPGIREDLAMTIREALQ